MNFFKRLFSKNYCRKCGNRMKCVGYYRMECEHCEYKEYYPEGNKAFYGNDK